MSSFAALQEWEVITSSGIFAIVALAIATIIGFAITHFAMRFPAVSRQASLAS
jgi:hypothetical protein